MPARRRRPSPPANTSLTGTGASNYTLGAVTNGSAVISPATLTATVAGANKTYDGTTSDPGATLTLNGTIFSGDSPAIASATYAFNSKNASQTPQTVTASSTSLTGTGASNYTLGSVTNGSAVISPASLTATVAGANKTYDGTTSDPGATLTLNGTIFSGDSLTGNATYAFNSRNAGQSAQTVTGSNASLTGIGSGNYTITSVNTGSAIISPAPLTATVAGANKTYDGTTNDPGATLSLNGTITPATV